MSAPSEGQPGLRRQQSCSICLELPIIYRAHGGSVTALHRGSLYVLLFRRVEVERVRAAMMLHSSPVW